MSTVVHSVPYLVASMVASTAVCSVVEMVASKVVLDSNQVIVMCEGEKEKKDK